MTVMMNPPIPNQTYQILKVHNSELEKEIFEQVVFVFLVENIFFSVHSEIQLHWRQGSSYSKQLKKMPLKQDHWKQKCFKEEKNNFLP